MKSPIFTVRTANRCLEDAKQIPTPMMLFDELWFEQELCILFADTNVGKSLLAVQVAQSIASGTAIPGFQLGVPGQGVLYYDFEFNDKQFEQRYSHSGISYTFSPNLYRIGYNPDCQAQRVGNQDVFAEIRSHIESYRSRVLIIDNLSYFAGNSLETAQEAIDFMREMKVLKEEFRLSIMLLAHTPKRNKSLSISEADLAGSAGLSRLADSLVAIGKGCESTDQRYIKQIKVRSAMLNYGAENVIKCRLAPRNGLLGFVFEGYCEESDLPRAADRTDINEQVMGLHAQYPDLSQAEIARQVGVNKMRVSRILAREGSSDNA